MTLERSCNVLLSDFPKLPLPLEQVEQLVSSSVDWAHAHGLVIRTAEHKDRSDVCQTAPFTLLPSPFPKKLFLQAVDVQNLMAFLYHEIAYDYEFLISCHEQVIKTDSFMRRLISILLTVKEEGLAQAKSLVIQRSDYMCHKDQFSCEYFLKQFFLMITLFLINHLSRSRLIISHLAWVDMLKGKSFGDLKALVLVVVEEVNQNQIDQRLVEYSLEEFGIPLNQIVRKTLTQCNESLSLSPERHLFLSGSRVAVVYFRAGYSPDNYPSEKEWATRLIIERSDAIKAPWIGLQIANSKKTQQVLAEDGVIERFINNPRDAAAIRATFASLWAIDRDDPITQKMIKGAITYPSRFVLKPQVEGGGGNFYGNVMAEKLKCMSQDERGAHILMERIQPLVVQNYLVRAMKPVTMSNVVSELGIYGYALGERGKAETYTGGHLLRTKNEGVDEACYTLLRI
uniref:Glutathione synthetase n=1 Tax=Heterorhabditis bacteriophora TaxID=37862 RepID=A0A1I7WRU1_HETBA